MTNTDVYGVHIKEHLCGGKFVDSDCATEVFRYRSVTLAGIRFPSVPNRPLQHLSI